MRLLSVVMAATFCVGCASTHDLREGPGLLGGGVQHSEIKPGLHSILVRTNWAPWSNYSGAKSSWEAVADSLCGSNNYKELGISEAARDTGMQPMGVLRYIVTERTGYALCNNAATNIEEAVSFLNLPPSPEIQIPPERISQNGYSLVPLNEKGWLIAGRNAYQLAIGKRGENPDETFAIQAIPFRLSAFKTNEEFVSMVREGQENDTERPRFKIVKHEVTAYPMSGTDCAKSHMVTEDRAAVKRTNRSGDMILEVLTLTCAHPKDKSYGISIIFSQRYYPGQRDPALIEKAASVLTSVEFNELEYLNSTSPQQLDSKSSASKGLSDLRQNHESGDCSKNSSAASAEIYLERGKSLLAVNEYKGALQCFLRVQEEEKYTQVYRDSCFQIAMMYELGWGVDKNMETAKAWLNKAGL